jgi:hypothetical protein
MLLRISPERWVYADGKDAVVVRAVLTEGFTAQTDIRVHLAYGSDRLQVKTLLIPRGKAQSNGLRITSKRTGQIVVRYERAEPNVQNVGDPEVVVTFYGASLKSRGPALDDKMQLELTPSPSPVSLATVSELTVRLLDARHRSFDPGRPMLFGFSTRSVEGRASGEGYITPRDTESKHGWARSVFVPIAIGPVVIDAWTPGIRDAESRLVEIQNLPTWLLLWTALGGLVGGLTRSRGVKSKTPSSFWLTLRAGLVGLIAGLGLYVALVLGVPSVSDQGILVRRLVSNALGVLLVGFTGGQLGTRVFTLLQNGITKLLFSGVGLPALTGSKPGIRKDGEGVTEVRSRERRA